MFDDYQICPYTGLRSFTEEESLYFKGREEHIDQATAQLQRNKFLMLTGASGDGKSSLIYAGIVPNARSGFLKSRYTRWCVADFRPERSPFENLCKAVAEQLEIEDWHIVESELQHGFSALIDLYQNSRRYIDLDSADWIEADDTRKAAMKREAGNLLILVDQFEEFFTNPENYHAGVPARESELVLNLLLESARIALEENLPVYIVFTMRSDYIGQCAAFRGLPEYIGFSQFFVPRLNRTQLQQVIEEPATLSGNRITRRLSERLIHDIVEGVDQLPILQHTLNQIWVAANNGTEEMDLIHYAMVGGMGVEELPEEHVIRYNQWYASLTPAIRACYGGPKLQNVLDTHTNKLYEQAADYYDEKTGKSIHGNEVKAIIRTAFTCLTKIDQSRAVRNRMTLSEIRAIHGEEKFSIADIGAVLNIFREPGNTFLRPFLKEDRSNETLPGDQVLDITHESLIRNWNYLEQWANEEYDDYVTFTDFEQQLNRWLESDKSGSFLLSIGPLTFFETWYKKVNPNEAWVARYLPEESEADDKLAEGRKVVHDAKELLRKSANSHWITRTVMKYGPRKLITALIILVGLVFLSFAGVDFFRRQNSAVLARLDHDVQQLVANPNIQIRDRAWLICEQLKAGRTTVFESVDGIIDPLERINVTTGVGSALVYYGRQEPNEIITESFLLSSGYLEKFEPGSVPVAQYPLLLKEMNDLARILELAYYYNPLPLFDSLKRSNAERIGSHILYILEQQPEGFDGIPQMNVGLEFAISHVAFSKDEMQQILQKLSPIDGNPSSWVKEQYAKNKVNRKGFFDYGLNFNGLYQELGYLYAALGDAKRALQAVDTSRKYNQNYYQGDYSYFEDNAYHIASCFFTYGQKRALDEFVQGYAEREGISEDAFYGFLLGRVKLYEFATTTQDIDPTYGHDLNLMLEFSSEKQVQFFYAKYRSALRRITDKDAYHYELALSYKDEGINQLKRLDIQGFDSLKFQYLPLFDEAIKLYRSVSQEYLDESITILDRSQNDYLTISRKYLFLFPDIKVRFHPNSPQLFHFNFTSDVFLTYILDNDLFQELYPSPKERRYFQNYFRDYAPIEYSQAYQVINPIDHRNLSRLEAQLGSGSQETFSNGFLYLHLIREAALAGNTTDLARYASQLKQEKLTSIFLNSFRPNWIFFQVGEVVKILLKEGFIDEAESIVAIFENPVNRSSLYAYAACELMRDGQSNNIDYLIDSAIVEMNRITNRNVQQRNRILIAYALALKADKESIEKAYLIIKNEPGKWFIFRRIGNALAFRGELYEAIENIPKDLSKPDYASFLWFILNGYNQGNEQVDEVWANYDRFEELDLTNAIIYVDDAN